MEEGIGGISGVGMPKLELGRDEFRRSLFDVGNEVGGAVTGVIGVRGMAGEFADFPLIRESRLLVEGVIAIFASASFCDIDRRRLCDEEDFMMGDAEVMVGLSKGSKLRKACGSGDNGVRGAECFHSDFVGAVDVVWMKGRVGCTAALTGRRELVHGVLLSADVLVKDLVVFSRAHGELLRVELSMKEESELCRALSLRDETVGASDGLRDCTLIAGEGDLVINGEVVELAARDRREAFSTLSNLLMAAIGSCSSEADRLDRWRNGGEPWFARSIIFGRPAVVKDTTTAKSQLFPFSNLETDILRA